MFFRATDRNGVQEGVHCLGLASEKAGRQGSDEGVE